MILFLGRLSFLIWLVINLSDEMSYQHYLSKSHFWIIIACLILSGIIFFNILDRHIGIAGDQPTYLSIAKSLSLGKGFQAYNAFFLTEKGELVSGKMSPLLYPLFISGVLWITNNSIAYDGIPYIKGVHFLLYIGIIIICYLLFSLGNRVDTSLLTWAMVLFTLHPGILLFVDNITTEIIYLFFSIVTLWMAYRLIMFSSTLNGFSTWIYLFFIYAGLMLTYFSRFIGISLVGAVLLTMLLQKRWRYLYVLSGSFGLLLVIFLVSPYEKRQLSRIAPLKIGFMMHGLRGVMSNWVGIVWKGLWYYLREMPMVVSGLTVNRTAWIISEPKGVIPFLISAGIWFCVVPGILQSWRRGSRLLELYVIFYIVVLLLFPVYSPRFLAPLIPFFLLYFFIGVDFWVKRLCPAQNHRKIVMIVSAVIVVGIVTFIYPRQYITAFSISNQKISERGYPVGWVEYYDAMEWLKQHTPGDVKIICKIPRLLSIYSGQTGIAFPLTADSHKMRTLFITTGVDYILRDGFEDHNQGSFHWRDTTSQYLDPVITLMRENGDIIPIYYVGPPSDPTVVYKIRR